MKVTFVLPTKGGGGGAHSVVQEVNELIKIGVNARIAVNAKHAPVFMTNYSDMPQVIRCLDIFKDVVTLAELLGGRDLVICTIFTSVQLVSDALDVLVTRATHAAKNQKPENPGKAPKIGYYVQDYEPLFASADDALRQQAMDSYTHFKDALLFAKTDWIRDVVTRNHGVAVAKVSPSLDTSIYYPGISKPEDPLWISAMIRPSTARRAPRRTMSVMKEIKSRYGSGVTVNTFGCSNEDMIEQGLPMDFEFVNHGVLSRIQVGALFRASEVFMDLSDYQAFGRSGLEAMACGCATVLPLFGGSHEYAVHNENSLLADTRSISDILGKFGSYMAMTPEARESLKNQAIVMSQRYSVSRAAFSEFVIFNEYLAA